uniref:Uncharacterized protein n=1 Tax=mine drainage metagenome TaxID=410659 RepID=E6PTF0_9ZZZZ
MTSPRPEGRGLRRVFGEGQPFLDGPLKRCVNRLRPGLRAECKKPPRLNASG